MMPNSSNNNEDVCNQSMKKRPLKYRYRCYRQQVAAAIVCLIFLNNGRCSRAFPTNGIHRPLRRPPFNHDVCQSPFDRDCIGWNNNHDHHTRRRQQQPTVVSTLSSTTTQLQQLSRAQKDELMAEEFQRSLLEAKIANDIKSTIVKDEQERNEIVTKKIDQEKEELEIAVKEVKEAVVEVSQSAVNLGGAITGTNSTREAAKEISKSAVNLGGAFITRGPGLFKRLVTLLATGEFR